MRYNENELIAEFMDEVRLSHSYSYSHPTYESWDKLMPVVDEINGYRNMEGEPLYSVEIDPNHVTIRRGLHTAIVVDAPQANSLQEMIYLAVVEFAKRFHQNGLSL